MVVRRVLAAVSTALVLAVSGLVAASPASAVGACDKTVSLPSAPPLRILKKDAAKIAECARQAANGGIIVLAINDLTSGRNTRGLLDLVASRLMDRFGCANVDVRYSASSCNIDFFYDATGTAPATGKVRLYIEH